MELFLQDGHQMRPICLELIPNWGRGTVVLSPRHHKKPEQLLKLAGEIRAAKGRVLIDPQLYAPKTAHANLQLYDYWPKDFESAMLLGGNALTEMLEKLRDLNAAAGAAAYIIPGRYCMQADDVWLAYQSAMIEEAASIVPDQKRIATICLSTDVLRSEEQIESILSASEEWDVFGYYIVPEHPGNSYLVRDANWLSNLLLLTSGLKLQEKRVIVAYSSHQMLCLAAANVDALACGSWDNLRSFNTGTYEPREKDKKQTPNVWYYCPQTLSEYLITTLDTAWNPKVSMLSTLRPDVNIGSRYADVLFTGARPTSTQFNSPQSFRHYLQSLHAQTRSSKASTFNDTFDKQVAMLERARSLIEMLESNGVIDRQRSFAVVIDANLSALTVLKNVRGFVLKRRWN